jgi:hypothetical protein
MLRLHEWKQLARSQFAQPSSSQSKLPGFLKANGKTLFSTAVGFQKG